MSQPRTALPGQAYVESIVVIPLLAILLWVVMSGCQVLRAAMEADASAAAAARWAASLDAADVTQTAVADWVTSYLNADGSAGVEVSVASDPNAGGGGWFGGNEYEVPTYDKYGASTTLTMSDSRTKISVCVKIPVHLIGSLTYTAESWHSAYKVDVASTVTGDAS
jgi:hypothetical protein